LANLVRRAWAQLRLPVMVLISPLWARKRNGWASGHLGRVLVEHADRGLQALVAQVRIEGGEVRRHHQAFVDDGLVRKAADVVFDIGGVGHRRATPGTEQLDREFLIAQAFATDEHLLDLRQALQRQATEHAGVDRHLAPAHQAQAGSEDLAVHVVACGFGLGGVLVEEHHADRVLAGQFAAELFQGHGPQEPIGLLHQQPAAVAGLAVGVDPTTVGHAGQGLDSRLQKVVAGFARHMGDQAETTVILEFFGMVQTCFHRHFLTRFASHQGKSLFNTTSYHPRRTNVSFAGAIRMPLLHSDSEAHKFTDASVKIHVAFLNVFIQESVVTELLESEAFQPGLQQGLVAGSLGQKSLPRVTQQARPGFRSRSAGGGGSATRPCISGSQPVLVGRWQRYEAKVYQPGPWLARF
jgi:hypothetical protein